MSIIVAILIFGLIVFIHEFGHYLFAVRAGILVEEFAIGMGPQITGIKRGDTLWSIRAVPFGGYCKMYGEDDAGGGLTSDEARDESIDLTGRAFTDKTLWQRFLVIFGGPFFNFILAFFFAMIYLSSSGSVSRTIDEVPEEYPAYEAGVRSGDVIVGYNGKSIIAASELILYLNNEKPEVAEIKVKRQTETGTERLTFNIIPDVGEDGVYRIGVNFLVENVSNPLTLVRAAAVEVVYWIKIVFYSLGLLLSGGVSGDDVAGPVGLVGAISTGYTESAQYGLGAIIRTMAFYVVLLSANLGVMNLLPIPALDGGRLMFLFYEAIFRKPVNPEIEGRIHFVGYILLMGLMVVILFNDIGKFFR